ncbi:MAG: gamma-glutamylcyclotransferase family protein [Desulfuromonadales bacterium]|jgi:gamma-glutamylcyclotransferase (GGCT)/AIG2-like uncharacterized protein YtfP
MAEQRERVEPLLPVFVYGTLRPGGKNYPRYLQGTTAREEEATVAGELYFVADGGYPYLSPGEGTVRGELMEILPSLYRRTLRRLDALEDYDPTDEAGSLYLRRRATVRTAQGECREAWVYYWNCPTICGEKIPDGDFRSG